MVLKPWIIGFLLASLSGCGTLTTLMDEPGAADDLAKWRSNCEEIPRFYSGAAYQFCNLNSPARSGSHWSAPPVLLDMVLSAIADTVMIPYTGYQQYKHGSILIRREQ